MKILVYNCWKSENKSEYPHQTKTKTRQLQTAVNNLKIPDTFSKIVPLLVTSNISTRRRLQVSTVIFNRIIRIKTNNEKNRKQYFRFSSLLRKIEWKRYSVTVNTKKCTRNIPTRSQRYKKKLTYLVFRWSKVSIRKVVYRRKKAHIIPKSRSAKNI